MANKLIVSLSPHVHSGDSVQKNMYGVLIALIPALLVSFLSLIHILRHIDEESV